MKPLELTLERWDFGEGYTGGRLYVDGMLFSDTIEPEDRGLSSVMSLADIKRLKVAGKTAIPYGRYKVTWAWSPRLHGRSYAKKYGGKFPLLNGVPGWSGVLIHPFNYGRESQGCIGPGERWMPGKVINSTLAYTDLMDFYLVPAFERGQEIWITVKQATE